MRYLRKFNENLKVDNSELIEMLQNINDILIPYRDDSEYILRVANVNINHKTRLTQSQFDANIVIISNDVEESLSSSAFYDWVNTPISVEIIPEKWKPVPVSEILMRLNEEYPNTFLVFFTSIISHDLEISNRGL